MQWWCENLPSVQTVHQCGLGCFLLPHATSRRLSLIHVELNLDLYDSSIRRVHMETETYFITVVPHTQER